MVKKVAIRIGIDSSDKVEVIRDFGEMQSKGQSTFNAVGQSVDTATQRLKALSAAQKQAAQYPTAGGLAQFSGVNLERPASAKASASAFSSAFADQERQAYALRTLLDPMAAAQERYNLAIQKANSLLVYNKISETEHAKAIGLARQEFDKFEKSQQSSRGTQLTSFQLQNLSYQLNDVVTGLLSGQSAFQVFAQQGGQIIQVFGGSGGVQKVLQGVTAFAISPMGLAIEATTAILAAGAIAGYQYGKSIVSLDMSLKGLGATAGLTGEQLKVMADQAGKAGGQATSDAEAQAAQLARAGVTNAEVIKGAIADVKGYALVSGKDMPAATQALTQALKDPVTGVKSLNDELLLWNANQEKAIESMARSGDVLGAQQEIIKALSENIAKSKDEVYGWAGAWDAMKVSVSNVWTELGRHVNPDLEDRMKDYQWRINQGNGLGNGNLGINDRSEAFIKDMMAYWQRQIQADADAKTATAKKLSGIIQGATDSLDPVASQRKALNDNFNQIVTAHNNKSKDDQGKLLVSDDQFAKLQKAYNLQSARLDQRDKMPGSDHAAALAREAAAMQVNIDYTYKLADAYLVGDSAALKAEATRAALTDATKKGTDQAAAAQRQLNLAIAQQAAEGAKSIATQRDQSALQKNINDQVSAGTLSYSNMTDAMALEQAKRPLIAAMDLAEGAAKERLKGIIDALTTSMKESNAERDRAAILQATGASDDAIKRQEYALSLVQKTNAERRVALAQYDALQELAKKKDANGVPISPDSAEGKAFVASKVGEARSGNVVDLAQYRADTAKSQADEIAIARTELALAGEQDNYRQLQIDKQKQIIALVNQGATAQEAANDVTVKNLDTLYAINQLYEQQKAYTDEIRGLQDKVFSDMESYLDAGKYSWKSLGSVAQSVLGDISAELIKLSIINPLKNSLFGENNATLSTALTAKSSSGSSNWFSTALSFLGFANGTENAPPGWAWVGEQGPELRKLRAGDVIKTHSASVRMASQLGSPAQSVPAIAPTIHVAPVVQFHVTGEPTRDQQIRMTQIATNAATNAAAEALKMANAQAYASVLKYSNDKA